MKQYIQPAAQYLLYIFALVWPLQVLVYVPYLNVGLPAVLATAAVLLLIADLVYGNTLRVPSELLWPVFLLAIIIGVASLFGGDSALAGWQAAGALLFFVAVAHFAGSLETVQRWLVATAVAAAASFVITLVAPVFGWHATAYSLDSPALLTFAYDLPSGAFIFFAGLAFGAAGAFALPFPRKLVAMVAALASAAGLLLLALASRPGWAAWTAPNVFAASWPAVLAILAAAWLWARAIAKTIRHAFIRRTPWHAALIAVAVAGALWLTVSAQAPGLSAAFILGAAAGITLPATEPMPRPRFRGALALLAIPLILINLTTVFPANEPDPRNYEAAARADLRRDDFDTLERRMRAFERRMPGESGLRLWLARAALAENELYASVTHMMESIRRAESGLPQSLPPVNEKDKQAWLVEMRDAVRQRPEQDRGWAYAFALATLGEYESALFRLNMEHAEDAPPEDGDAALGLFNLPLNLLEPRKDRLPDSLPFQPFRKWGNERLVELFRKKGAYVFDAPESVWLPPPYVIALRPSVEGVYYYTANGTTSIGELLPPYYDGRLMMDTEAVWEPPTYWLEESRFHEGQDELRVAISVRYKGDSYQVIEGYMGMEWVEMETPSPIPFEPLVAVWQTAGE